jgi:hypothetical protein
MLHPSGYFYVQEFRRLRQLCRDSGLVPTSSKLPKDIDISSSSPLSLSYFSDVYRGRLGDRDVAVKVLRLHIDEAQRVKKVRLPAYWRCARILHDTEIHRHTCMSWYSGSACDMRTLCLL